MEGCTDRGALTPNPTLSHSYSGWITIYIGVVGDDDCTDALREFTVLD